MSYCRPSPASATATPIRALRSLAIAAAAAAAIAIAAIVTAKRRIATRRWIVWVASTHCVRMFYVFYLTAKGKAGAKRTRALQKAKGPIPKAKQASES
jgi:hypothetical protein